MISAIREEAIVIIIKKTRSDRLFGISLHINVQLEVASSTLTI
jgi:hypothetical protein